MAVTVDSVIVQLDAKIDKYNSDINSAAANTERKLLTIAHATDKMSAAGSAGFNLLKGAAAGFVASLSIGVITDAIKAGLEYAGSLGEVSQQLGIGTKFLQEFRFAATQNGTSIEQADGALGKFSINLGKAFNGNKEAVAGFKELGLSISTLAKQTDSQRYEAVADAIANIKDPAQQAAAAIEHFGRGGLAILPTLQAGAAGFRAQADEAKRYGLILSDSQIQNADKTADKIAALTQALQAKIAATVADNAAAIGRLANALADLAGWAVKAGQQFIGFANIMHNQGIVSALATYRGADLVAAGTPKGNAVSALRGAASDQRRLADAERQVAYAPNSTSNQQELAAARKAAAASIANAREAVAAAKASLAPSAGNATAGGNADVKPVAGGAGKTGAGAGKDPAQTEREFNRALAREQEDYLRIQQDLTGSASARADIDRDLTERQRVQSVEDVNLNKDYSAARKATLTAAINKAASAELDLINQREVERLADEGAKIAIDLLSSQSDILKLQEGFAKSAEERRDIEQSIIASKYEEEKIQNARVLAAKDSSDAEKAAARLRNDTMAQRQNLDTRQNEKQNAGPGGQYLDDLRKSAQGLNEDFQQVAVDGLKSLNDGIADAITSGKSLGDVFDSVVNQIISGLIKIAIQQAIIKPLGESLFGGGGIGGIVSSIGGLFGRASGGDVQGGQMYRVNETGTEGFQPAGSGKIIPLGRMPTANSGGGQTIIQSFTLDARGGIVTQDLIDYVNQQAGQAAIAGASGGAALASRNFARSAARRLA